VIDQSESAQIETDGLTIDLLSRHAWREDRKVELSSREFALLEYFMRHSGQVLSAIWDYDFEPASNVVDVYVRHLRNKVDPPDGPSLIQTTSAAPVTVSILSQPPGLTARLPEDFKMKKISSQVHRGFMHGVYNPGMWTAGGNLNAEHRVTAAGGRPSWVRARAIPPFPTFPIASSPPGPPSAG
jgi:Transcriptional regulatory protein, C terminal